MVKPALDADTLHVPAALIVALTARLQQITKFQNVHFAVLHTTELNYFQIGASNVREFAAEIARIVPGAPKFPPDVGIIALPYSQCNSLFLNTALAHEMGHYAFQERNEAARLVPAIIKQIQLAAGVSLPALDLVWCKDRVLTWCEEVYCDLFALWLIGPSFTFAFIELFAYSRLAPKLSPTGPPLPPIASESNFKDSHPAAAFRLGEHVRFLKRPEVGWWNELVGGSSHFINLLTDAEALPNSSFSFVSKQKRGLEALTLKAFFQVIGEVPLVVKDAFAGVPTDLECFQDQRKVIQEYLTYGVVPSRLVRTAGVEQPSTVALINSSHLFYLEDLDSLISKVRGGRVDCLECRALWSERVEMWTSKALEDVNF